MPDFANLLDPPLQSAPQEEESLSLADRNVEVSGESDRNAQLGLSILLKEDELNPENGVCVELEQKEIEVQALVSDQNLQVSSESDRNIQLGLSIVLKEDDVNPKNGGYSELEPKEIDLQGLISDQNLQVSGEYGRNIQLGFPILLKEDELKPENGGCVELELKEAEVQALVSKRNVQVSSESDRNNHLGFPILLKEDGLRPKNNGCSELELKEKEVQALASNQNVEVSSESDRNTQLGFPVLLKEDELILENDGCCELESKEDEVQALVSDRNSQLGFSILQKEDELMLEIDGCVELESKEGELIPENDGCCELESKEDDVHALVSDGNSQLGLSILHKEDELMLENDGCVELELKEDELKPENDGYSELEQKEIKLQGLGSDSNTHLGFHILHKEDKSMPEDDGYSELELKEDELIPKNDGCGELEQKEDGFQALVSDGNPHPVFSILQKEDELMLENDGCVELELKEDKVQALVSDRNSQSGFSILQKEDELMLENDGHVELELKEDEVQGLVSDGNSQLGFSILQKEDQLVPENDRCVELELKGDELIPENDGCSELEEKEDELKLEKNGCGELGFEVLRSSGGGSVAKKSLDEFVKEWVERRVNAGVDKHNCVLPFLVHAPKSVGCFVCQRLILPGDEVECSVRDCTGVFHLECAKEKLGLSSPKMFKCPQHVCYVCNKKIHLWRCIRCPLASHDKCAAFPEHVVHLNDQPGRVICWKHPSDWRLEKQHAAPTSNLEEIFANLPLPYVEEEFKIDLSWKDMIDNRFEPPPYVHIKRNAYLIKKKRDGANADIGCTNCRSTECSDNCVCRVQCISCSKACHCSDMCSNRPFRRDRKIKVVKTELCGWGVIAAESISKGDFIIEYIGEVIDDALCEKRLWDMKYKGDKNFYMCELRKDFTIDATFKGNLSRFLNHSCDPNCKLEKWQVEGETRVGVFAARSIEVGEPLTYDYRFVQFGPEVKCHCGASNCQGYLGSKKKITSKLNISWGSKRKRTSTSCLAIIKSNSC